MKAILAKKLIFNNCILQSTQQRNSFDRHTGGCDKSIGLGIGLGADNSRLQLGGGYNQGIIERTGDHHLVWLWNRLRLWRLSNGMALWRI